MGLYVFIYELCSREPSSDPNYISVPTRYYGFDYGVKISDPNDLPAKLLEHTKEAMKRYEDEILNAFCVELDRPVDTGSEEFKKMIFSSFEEGTKHEFWTDICGLRANNIGFDPDKHVFVCHKCGGVLVGNLHGSPRCGCISGWVRDTYSYIDHDQYVPPNRAKSDK